MTAKKATPAKRAKKAQTIRIEVICGVMGNALYVNGHRVSGEKPWGGGYLIGEWEFAEKELARALGKKKK